jgi:ketosteroid isomerase-like protein
MKGLKTLTAMLCFAAMGTVLLAQAPQTPAAGQGRGGGGAAGGRGGGRGNMPQVPPAPQPLQDIANKIADSINKQDAATLTGMLSENCVYLDEDGHAPAVSRWVTNLTSGGKKIDISMTHGQIMGDAAWLSFNFAVTETFQGNPKTIKGTATMALQKAGNDWKIQMIHGSFFQKVAGITDGN